MTRRQPKARGARDSVRTLTGRLDVLSTDNARLRDTTDKLRAELAAANAPVPVTITAAPGRTMTFSFQGISLRIKTTQAFVVFDDENKTP